MTTHINLKESLSNWFLQLQKEIIVAFEAIEESTSLFDHTCWKHHTGGGGHIRVLRGKTFEKAAVNCSSVWGDHYPLDKTQGPFYASGVSVITHMVNPKMPTVHFNVRYIEVGDRYHVGGGFDLTPMGFEDMRDSTHFHREAKRGLDTLDTAYYPKFMRNAKEYFYIPHRKKERGVGGIFFDHITFEEDPAKAEHLLHTVSDSFLEAIIPIYKRKKHLPYVLEDKEKQLKMRGEYVEFNLLYDRGTRFGFFSNGNPDAILCSMPPLVSW